MRLKHKALGCFVARCVIDTGKEVIASEIINNVEHAIMKAPNYLKLFLLIYLELTGLLIIIQAAFSLNRFSIGSSLNKKKRKMGFLTFIVYQLVLFSVLNTSLNE